MNLLSLTFSTPAEIITNVVIIAFIVLGIFSGIKKGFLESSVRFIGTIIALVFAYALKNPLSVFLYTHLPFFKLTGIFKGVTALNIVIYELIAFMIVFSIMMLIINIVVKITGLFDRILSFILLFGLPNKILGGIVGFIESIIVLYFVCFIYTFGVSLAGASRPTTLVDDIMNIPVLERTFGDSFNSITDIATLAQDYESINDKDEYNQKALETLMKYDIITCENAKALIEDGKIEVLNKDEIMKVCEK